MTLPTVVSHLPCVWQGLFKALFVVDWPLAAAETWLRQNQDSAYGDTLSWTALIEALCREEPVSCKETLKFKPRLFHLPPSLQQHLMAIIHKHHQEICVDTLQHFVTVLQSGGDEMSTGWLRTYIGWLKWNCQRRCDANRDPCGSVTFSFSAENEGHFKALCSKLSTIERSRHKRIWQVAPRLNSESSDSNVYVTSSPAQSGSPLSSSLPVVNDVETPSKAKSPTQASHNDHDSCLSTDSDDVHKKRKLQEDDVTLDDHSGSQVEEIGSRETDNMLDSDVQVMVTKLKEMWEAGTEEPLPKKELVVFTQFPTQTMIDVCTELAKSGLSEVAIVTACKHLCGVSDEISHEKALVFATSLLLPMVLGLHGTASRSLLSAVIMFSGPFAKPLIEAVLVPCTSSDKFGSYQVDLLSHVLKTFNPAQQKEFLRKFLSESWPWNESISSFLLNILDLKIDLGGEHLSMLISSLKRSGIEQIKGLKFAKVLLEMINKYGKQMTATHIGQLSEILQQNESFLKKSALTALGKLQTPKSN